jgi:hypothetical protein
MPFTPPKPKLPDAYGLAIDVLVREDRVTEAQARSILQKSPPETLRALAQRGAERFADQATSQAQAEYDRSPEGLREAADRQIAVSEERATDVARAKAILTAQGISYDDLAGFSDDRLLDASGIVPATNRPTRSPSKFITESKVVGQ